ncbi:hypothetical protein BDC45DRAFT_99181 [Circinella umbellata]|nr:hypothetical protein BDC45DRAFT_99181 [Circinella umbellata]
MDISHIQVIARVQRSEQLNSLAEPRLVINRGNEESVIIVENVDDVSSNNNQNQFSFSKCITDFNVDTEIKQSVNLALDGYDTGIIFMSTSGKDNYKERQKLRHQLLEYLDSRLDVINSLKASRSQDHIKMEFAHLGITDDSCYDLRTQRQFKNSQVLELGLDICMKRIESAKAIWEKGKVKFGSSFSSILTIRLSDNATFMGSVTIVDLLHPWSKPHRGSNNLFYSFDKLSMFLIFSNHSKLKLIFFLGGGDSIKKHIENAVDQITENGFEGVISVESFVLTKLLGCYFCGLRKTTIVMEFDQHPNKLMGDTLRALEFGQKLHNLRSTVQRNELDPRLHNYKEQLRHLQYAQEENKRLLIEKEQLRHEYLQNNCILKEKLEQNSHQLHDRDSLIEEMKNQIQTLEKSSKAYEEVI